MVVQKLVKITLLSPRDEISKVTTDLSNFEMFHAVRQGAGSPSDSYIDDLSLRALRVFLSLDEIDAFSSSINKIDRLILTGGEPFLGENFLEVVSIFLKNNSPSLISIPTNGYFIVKILKDVRKILGCNNQVK